MSLELKNNIKDIIQNIVSSSSDTEKDLLEFVIKYSEVNRVDLYNIFYKLLKKYENLGEYEYDALANIMDYIWTGNAGEIQLYEYPLSDEDIKIRESSKRFFKIN